MKKHKVEWTWADKTLQICQSKIPWILRVHKRPDGTTTGIVRPQQQFLEKHGLGIATVFVEQQNNSLPIRIINASERPKEL